MKGHAYPTDISDLIDYLWRCTEDGPRAVKQRGPASSKGSGRASFAGSLLLLLLLPGPTASPSGQRLARWARSGISAHVISMLNQLC